MADALDDVFPDDPAEPVGEVAEPVVQPEVVDPTPVVAEAPAPEPEVVETPKPEQAIPLATALQWRDDAKAAKRRADELEAAQARSQQQRPDPLDDPEGYGTYLTQQMEARLSEQKFAMSDAMARQVHPVAEVDAALEWATQRAQSDPVFAASYMREANPVDWIVRQHKREGLLSDIGDNVDDWFTREAAKRGYAPQSAPAAVAPIVAAIPQPAPKPVVVPKSLATQGASPSDVREVASGPLAGVDAVFN